MTRYTTTIKTLSIPQDKVVQITFAGVFAVLTAIAAQIEIPTVPVPITLQTFFVLLTGGLLSRKTATLSMLLYVFAGAIGMPVFAGGSFGIAKLLGPTGGYLWSFPLAAALVATITEKRQNFPWMITAMSIGALLIFLCGTLQLYAVYFHEWLPSLQAGFFIFSLWDAVKVVAAASIATQVRKILH